ncbi:hypothetical protein ACPPVU_21555 [Mucilaginibacter sp. McL0603]|uniref:hypothetical protein n=1 Tax=Mucilaginibacter sp. McL0603 TaxID=3415670 RepID=UPI003CFA26AB
MQIQVDIGFDDLIRIVKELPKEQLLKFKKELEKQNTNDTQLQDLESFLLTAPTFSDKQLEEIGQTRKAINQWRKK